MEKPADDSSDFFSPLGFRRFLSRHRTEAILEAGADPKEDSILRGRLRPSSVYLQPKTPSSRLALKHKKGEKKVN